MRNKELYFYKNKFRTCQFHHRMVLNAFFSWKIFQFVLSFDRNNVDRKSSRLRYSLPFKRAINVAVEGYSRANVKCSADDIQPSSVEVDTARKPRAKESTSRSLLRGWPCHAKSERVKRERNRNDLQSYTFLTCALKLAFQLSHLY